MVGEKSTFLKKNPSTQDVTPFEFNACKISTIIIGLMLLYRVFWLRMGQMNPWSGDTIRSVHVNIQYWKD